jgi:tRNA A22 N-methylase
MVEDKGRVYAVMAVSFDGIKREYSPAELLLGRKNIEKGTELFVKQLDRRIDRTKQTIDERKSGGFDCAEFEALLCEMENIKEKTI